jgi:hypothetical protein
MSEVAQADKRTALERLFDNLNPEQRTKLTKFLEARQQVDDLMRKLKNLQADTVITERKLDEAKKFLEEARVAVKGFFVGGTD